MDPSRKPTGISKLDHLTAVLRVEKAGRKGKTVTVIDRLPRSETYVRDLASRLKSRCGAGGTCEIKPTGGLIEIQGDRREQIRVLLIQEGMAVKG